MTNLSNKKNKDFLIRKAVPDDINDILILYHPIWQIEATIDDNLRTEFDSSKELHDLLLDDIKNNECIVLVALLDNKLIGYICGKIISIKTAYFEEISNINEISVLPEYQKQGIGEKLLNEYINVCKAKGVGYIKLTAFEQNTNAIRFYTRNGFKPYSVVYRKRI